MNVLLRTLPLLMCIVVCAGADAATYQHTAATFNFISAASHTRITAWPGCGDTSGDDSLSAALGLGFTFNFGGIDYTQVRVMVNGRLQFNNTSCGAGTVSIGPPRTYFGNYPNASLVRSLRIYGADLDVSASGGGYITFASTGTAPNRIFVVTWNNVSQWKAGGATNFGNGTAYNLQIQLHENGDFYFMYGVSDDVSEPANQAMGPAQIGWELTTTDFVVVQTGLPASNTGLHFFYPATLAEYRFDQGALTGAAGEVLDSSGNLRHGTRVNTPSNSNRADIVSPGFICQALAVPANNTLNQVDAVNTGIAAASIGSSGTLTFWHKSNAAWGSGRSNLLFDASSNGRSFYLLRDRNARLVFVLTDSAGTTFTLTEGGSPAVAGGVWTHLAVSWRLSGGAAVLTIYRNGATVATSTTAGAAAGLHAALGTLHIGDNHPGNNVLANATRSADGQIDEFRTYNSAGGSTLVARDMAITRSCATFDHFALSHAGNGVTCAPATVQLAAHLADHSVFTGYQGTVSLTTSTARGDWSVVTGSGTLNNGTADDGAASYAFAARDSGTVSLGLRHTSAATVAIDVTDGTASERGGSATAAEDAPLVFATTGFAFLANGAAGALATQIAGKESSVAPNVQSLQLAAIRTSDGTGACAAALAGTQRVDIAYQCVSPATCAGGPMRITAASSADVAANPAVGVSSYTPVSFQFDPGTGRAPFTLNYGDAGQVQLHARFQIPLSGGGGSGNFMAGSSNAFVSRPFALAFTVTGNPAARGAAGARFVAAATPFDGSLRAVRWSAADDANGDGIADGHEGSDVNAANNANLADNAITPNFSPAAAATVGVRLDQPAGGNAPALAGTTAATLVAGAASVSGMRYDEVGIVELSAAQGGDYLGIGAAETAKIRGASDFVGRFHPARFAVSANAPAVASACGTFTYLDQPFSWDVAPVLTVTALNARGAVTRNYTAAGFFKLATTLAARSYADASGSASTFSADLAGAVTVAGDTGLTGSATLALAAANGDAFVHQRTQLTGPFDADLDARFAAADLTDSDGVCHDPDADGTCDVFEIAGIGGTPLRFGRLQALNAFGSELVKLPVTARTEYYTGSGFTANLDDACTSIPLAALDLGIDGTAGSPAPGDPTIPLGAGASTANLAFTPVAAGNLGLTFSPPGAGNTGDLDYRFDLSLATGAQAEWLRYDWNGDGVFDDDPGGRVSFGIYGGRAAVIYIREPW